MQILNQAFLIYVSNVMFKIKLCRVFTVLIAQQNSPTLLHAYRFYLYISTL